jgi:hypothetical protein
MGILFYVVVVLILYACGQFCCAVDVSTFLLALVPLAEACWLLFGSQIKYQPESYSVIFNLKTTNDFGSNPRDTGRYHVRVLLCQRKYFYEW